MPFPPSTPQQSGSQQPSASQYPTAPPVPNSPQQAQPQHPAGAPAAPQQAPAAPYQAAPRPQPMRQAEATTLGQTNAFALVAIIMAFIAPILGIIFGHLSLSQIKRTGDAGRGLALTGLIFGYAYVAFIVLFMIFYVSMIGLIIASAGAAFNDFGSYDSF